MALSNISLYLCSTVFTRGAGGGEEVREAMSLSWSVSFCLLGSGCWISEEGLEAWFVVEFGIPRLSRIVVPLEFCLEGSGAEKLFYF